MSNMAKNNGNKSTQQPVEDQVQQEEVTNTPVTENQENTAKTITKPVAETPVDTVEQPPVEEVKAPVEPEPVKEPEPVITESVPMAEASTFDKFIENLKKNGSFSEKAIIESFESYIRTMNPGVIVIPTMGAKYQRGLYLAIKNVLEGVPAQEFKAVWNIVLAYFNNYSDGVFSDKYVHRCSEQWINEADLNKYQRLVDLISMTCNPETRSIGIKQVDLNRIMDGFTDEARTRVVSFYGK